MSHSIITGASHDATEKLKHVLKFGTRHWQNFFAASFGFRDTSGAAAFERRHKINLDDMFKAEAIILDQASAVRWLKEHGVPVNSETLTIVIQFINDYWKLKRRDSKPTFYWSMAEYMRSLDKLLSHGKLSEPFFAGNGWVQVPADLPWTVGLEHTVIPEWPQGIVMPKLFKPSHGEESFISFPMKILQGDVEVLDSEHRALFPRRTVLGHSKVTFFWPRGLTHHFTDAPLTSGFDDSGQEFSWSLIKFGPNNSQSGNPIPLSSVLRTTVLSGLDYEQLSFDVGTEKTDSFKGVKLDAIQAALESAARVTPQQDAVQAALEAATRVTPQQDAVRAALEAAARVTPQQDAVRAALEAATRVTPQQDAVRAALEAATRVTPQQEAMQAAIEAATRLTPHQEAMQAAIEAATRLTPQQEAMRETIEAAARVTPQQEAIQAAIEAAIRLTPHQDVMEAAIKAATPPTSGEEEV